MADNLAPWHDMRADLMLGTGETIENSGRYQIFIPDILRDVRVM